MAFLAGSFPFTSVPSLMKKIWKPVLAFAGSGLSVLAAQGLPVAVQLGLGIGVYALLLLVTRGLTAEDWSLVRSVVRPESAA